MKLHGLVALSLSLLLIPTLRAQDIDQAWGISAGLYENKLNEIAISYGLSNRTMLLFFTDLLYQNEKADIDITGAYTDMKNRTAKDLSLLVGSEIRGFFYTGRVSPFGGVRFSSGWQTLENVTPDDDWQKKRQLQVNVGVVYGAEYFIKNSISVYVSMNLFTYSLIRTINEDYNHLEGLTTKDTVKAHRVHFSQNAAIFLKIYF